MVLGLTRTLNSIAPLGLSAIIGSSALDAAPADNFVEATFGALSLAGIFSLGACGLVLLRFRYPAAAPTAIAALALTVLSFLRTRDHIGGLGQIGLVDFLLTLGICGRAMWAARQAERQRDEP